MFVDQRTFIILTNDNLPIGHIIQTSLKQTLIKTKNKALNALIFPQTINRTYEQNIKKTPQIDDLTLSPPDLALDDCKRRQTDRPLP